MGHVEIVKLFLERGIDVNIGIDSSLKDDEAGMTPLHCAARAGQMEVVKLLLEHGADCNAVTAVSIRFII
jgi:ankyrin repeat protein